jgi:hypothetical protein
MNLRFRHAVYAPTIILLATVAIIFGKEPKYVLTALLPLITFVFIFVAYFVAKRYLELQQRNEFLAIEALKADQAKWYSFCSKSCNSSCPPSRLHDTDKFLPKKKKKINSQY